MGAGSLFGSVPGKEKLGSKSEAGELFKGT